MSDGDLDEFIKMRPEERPTLPPGVRPEEIRDALRRAKLDDEARAAERAAELPPRDGPTMSLPDTDPKATPTLNAAEGRSVPKADPEPDRSAMVFATAMVITVGAAAGLAILGYAVLNGLLSS